MPWPSAECYGVGSPIREMILVARGEQGRVWRLDTDHGAFAIKELIIRQTPADASPMPPIKRSYARPVRCGCRDPSGHRMTE